MAIALLTLGLIIAQPASEVVEEPQPPETQRTPDIVVTADRLPDTRADAAYGEFEVEPLAVELAPRQSLETLLPLIPGAQQFRRADSRSSNPTAQGLTLRALGGNASARTLVLRDGVPVADPFFGSVPFNSLLLGSATRISVTPGAGAGPFGGGAIAGVVEIESDDPLTENEPKALLSIGSFDTLSATFGLASRLGRGGIRLAAWGERSDGFWTTPADQRTAASIPAAYRHWAAELAGTAQAADGRLDVRFGLFDDRRALRFAGADSRSQGADISARWVRQGQGRFTESWDVEAIGWLQLRDFSATTISATSFRPVLEQRATPTLGWGAKIELRPPIPGPRTLRLGVDLRGAQGRTDEIAVNASGAVTLRRRAGGQSVLAGIFAEHDARFGPLVVAAGLRLDRWWLSDGVLRETSATGAILADQNFPDRSLARWTARGAASYHLDDDWTLRAAAYRGFRVPTLNELYRPFVLFPVTTRANAELAPERLTGVEGGIVYSRGTTADGFTLTAFVNRVEGAIANVTIGPNLRQRANLPAIRTQGLEFAGRVGFGLFGVMPSLQVTAAWTDAEVEGGSIAPALSGLRPAQAARFSGSIAMAVLGPGPLLSTIVLRHGGRQFEDDRNVDILPAYTALDLSGTILMNDRLSLSLSAENVTNTRILTRNSGGSIDLGAPRSIRLTLRLF